MRPITLMLCLLGVFTACASVPMAPPAWDQDAKQFRTAPDTALVYIVRDGWVGTAVLFDVYVDGTLVGALAPHTYLTVPLTPGVHHVASITQENHTTVSLQVEPQQTYFIRLTLKMGWVAPRAGLAMLAQHEGRAAVLASQAIAPMAHP